ncbi:MAG TPA: hypothetical protein VD948_12740 [Rhodothermales bacterium]|nr:hypothetical protein [Rhodothermales bacterium]
MTAAELTRRALLLLAAGNPSSDDPWLTGKAEAAVGTCVPYAMQELADEVSRDSHLRGLLQQDYSVTVSAGIGNLLTATGSITSAADMLIDAVPLGQVKDAAGDYFEYVPHRRDFEGYLPAGLKYFTVTGTGRIYVRSAVSGVYSSDLGDVTSPLTVTASWTPAPATIASIPGELDELLVKKLVEVVLRKAPEGPGKN